MTLDKIIIIVAVIAFIIAVIFIYKNEISNYLKSKLPKFKKQTSKKEVKEEKPKEKKEEKKEPLPSVEEFKPITKSYEQESRDQSIEQLLADEDFPFGMDDFDDSFLFDAPKSGGLKSSLAINDEFEDLKRMLGKEYGEKSVDKQTIAEKIRKLPPEIKVMLMDNVLKKRDDI